MQIKMDTDAVRAMASRLRQSADILDSKLAAIKSTVNSAGWQSQAREEYIMRLEMLTRSTNQSTTVLRMMAQAADRKAEQWEAIARIFNGPFHYLTGLWNSVLAFFNRMGSGLMDAISNIHLPTLPNFVFPTISGAAIVGGIKSIIPEWDWNPPSWWPFNKQGNNDHYAGGGAGGSGGGSWGDANSEDTSEPSNENSENNTDQTDEYTSQYDGNSPANGTIAKPWADINPPLTNDENNRNPDIYDDVLNQFAVESNKRYQKNQQGKNETYCNIFVWDSTKAMGAEIPHWVDHNGNPVPQGTGTELSANGTIRWLEKYGEDQGWQVVTAEQAQAMANQGNPVVASWNNPDGIGHVAMVRPGEYSEKNGVTIAQAGANNSNYTNKQQAFGNREVVYYYHN